MSIGPNEKNSDLTPRKAEKILQTTKTFFEKPIHYLFYGSLTLTILGLFFGIKLPWEFYTILFLLWVSEMIPNFKQYVKKADKISSQ